MEPRVNQDVVVYELTLVDNVIHVDLYGGPDNVCTSVPFTPKDASARHAHLRTLRRWERSRTPLTFIVTPSSMSLQDRPFTVDRELKDS